MKKHLFNQLQPTKSNCMPKNSLYQDLRLRVSIFFYILFLCASCGEDDLDVSNKYLRSSILIESLSQSNVETIATIVTGYTEASNGLVTEGVDVYKIIYNTKDPTGRAITASGLVILPQTLDDLPILSFQREVHCYEYAFNSHRYPICNSDKVTPSNNPDISEINAMKVIAASGFVTVIPDLLGFGENSISKHRYEHGNSLATVSFDMIKATQEFLIEHKLSVNGKLFLGGHGMGGYATMALHKYIEDSSNLEVTMSAPAAGFYDKLLLANTVLTDLSYYGHGELMTSFIGYDDVYGLNRHSRSRTPYSSFNFRNDYDKMVSEFVTGVDKELINVVMDNNRSDWYPKGRITMYQPAGRYQYHNENELQENGRSTYTKLKSNGAIVELVEYPNESSHTTFPLYLVDLYKLIYNLK